MNELVLEEKQKLPNGWIKTSLESLSFKITDGTHFTPHYEKNGIPFISVRNIQNETICFENCKYISKTTHKKLVERCNPEFGDLLITKSGTIGRIAIVNTKKPFSLFVSVALVKLTDDVDKIYLKRTLQNFFNYIDISKQIKGAVIKNFHLEDIRQVMILLPPLQEQKRIVSKIESIFAQIDATRMNLENIQLMLKRCRQSVLKHAFEGKLVLQDPDDKSAEILLKRIHKESHKEIEFDKGNLPEGWINCKINNICELIGGGTPSRKHLEYFDGGIIWLTPTQIIKNKIKIINDSKEKITELGLKKSSAKLISKHSVLLTTRASIGYVAIAGTEVTTNQGFASFVCSGTISNYYLAYWLFSKKNLLESQATGTTFKEISKSTLRELEIPLPPLNEQKRIVAKIESIFDRIDAVERYVESTLNRLGALKKSTLKQAFEGKLVPQDPNDELAEILLQKIKQERKQLIQKQKPSRKIKNVK